MFVLLRAIASIFYQILYMSILASIIGLVILLIQKITNRKFSPKSNYFIWIAFVMILIFPITIPSRISIYNFIRINDVKIVEYEYNNNIWDNYNAFNSKENIEENPITSYNNISLFSIDFKIIVANFIIIISCFRIIILLISYYLLIKKFGNEKVTDKRILTIIDECKKELGIKRNIKIINQDISKLPAIIGVFDVKILFTEGLLSLDDSDLKNMFLHELAHYKRKDNLMNFAIMILETVYWFNPIIKYMFCYIKREMEFATDELAIKNMNIEQTRNYCKTIIFAEEMNSSKIVSALGFVDELKYVDKRIDFISLKPKFKKFSKIISSITIFIILMICLIFYPTSYGFSNTPKLYLQTDNGNLTEIQNIDKFNTISNCIEINKNSTAKLIIKDGGVDNYIYIKRINTLNDYEQEKETMMLDDNIVCFEEGEYYYNFVLVKQNKKSFNYSIKVIVK